jgi:hypothetical protein
MKYPKKISVDDLAELLGCTTRWVNQLSNKGYYSPAKNGIYEFVPAIRGIFKAKGESKSPAAERLNEQKCESLQRKNRIAEKMELREYMETSEVSGLLELGVKALDLIPSKMESEFGLGAEQTKRLTQLLDEARAEWVKQIKKCLNPSTV